MENIWGILVRYVYAQCRTFINTDELEDAIISAWHRLDVLLLERLQLQILRHWSFCWSGRNGPDAQPSGGKFAVKVFRAGEETLGVVSLALTAPLQLPLHQLSMVLQTWRLPGQP
ncbi:hypothetical protein ANCDUO_12197 [Ancylostoma duodenale]|uniref:Uncharacterized protein n=1 Tax=Ancylostoma duodenale TaxID=51022 RepID=A0A0C2GKK0_9BILA|nr:hypothetical protein ANCDUO_12197 [Ancylostoma duodenale]